MPTPQPLWGPEQEATPPPLQVTPQEGDWLDELLGQWEAAKARAKEAKDFADGLNAKVKIALTHMAPRGTEKIEVSGNAWRKARTLNWITPRKFNEEKFKAEHPDVHEAYKEYTKPYWSW